MCLSTSVMDTAASSVATTDNQRRVRGKLSLKRKRDSDSDTNGSSRGQSEVQLPSKQARQSSSPSKARLHQPSLPDLPVWYGVKKKEEDQISGTEIVKVGDVSIEWRPLPAYCRRCVVRRKQTRAAEHQGHLRTSAGASIKQESRARDIKQVPDHTFGDVKIKPQTGTEDNICNVNVTNPGNTAVRKILLNGK